MQQEQYGAQLGQAWAQHRQGQQREAASSFEQILKASPDHVDALYGLGLVHKAIGSRKDAKKTFERCLEIVRAARNAEPTVDRHLMLERIVRQRLQELDAK